MDGTMFCKHCGEKIDQDCIICPKCGKQVAELKTASQPQINIVNTNTNTNTNMNVQAGYYGRRCNKWVAFFLCLFLGFFGIHKFYEHKPGLGILYLFTGGLFAIGWLVDCIIILCKPNPYFV